MNLVTTEGKYFKIKNGQCHEYSTEQAAQYKDGDWLCKDW
jgi:formylmethanofuran dehydrogenase subunit E